MIDQHFNNRNNIPGVKDKNYFSLWFPDAKKPETVVRKINGIFYSSNYRIMSLQQAIDNCYKYDKLIIKPAVGTHGGKGIVFWYKAEMSEGIEKILRYCGQNLIVQEIIVQHKNLDQIHSASINTIRVMTLLLRIRFMSYHQF